MMRNLAEECAAMAATMLDAELMSILRRLPDDNLRTPLQQAVEQEARKRNMLQHG